MRTGIAAVWLLTVVPIALAQAPVGVVWSGEGATLLRQGTELPVRAEVGDLLFPGDSIDSQGHEVTLWFCPSRQELRITGAAEAQVSAQRVHVSGFSERRELNECLLPRTEKAALQRVRFFGARARGIGKTVLDGAPQETLARAVKFEAQGQWEAARNEYERLSQQLPQVDWPRKLVHAQEEQINRQRQEALKSQPKDLRKGQTLGLFVGISSYARLRREEQLQFAAEDANSMAAFFRSPRGGALPVENIALLTNQNATSAALRSAIETTIRDRATRNDTVFIFIAAHGVFDNRGAYIITHDSDPEDLPATAIPMTDLQELIEQQSSQVGRVFLFVDICRSGTIGSIAGNKIHSAVDTLLRMNATDSLVLLSSGSKQYSFESERFGGGHGAFSYFLLRGLNGDADADKDGRVRSEELVEYVRSSVRTATRAKQTPRESGTMDPGTVVVDKLDQPGIELEGWRQLDNEARVIPTIQRKVEEQIKVAFTSLSALERQTLIEFEEAESQARVLPETPGSAFGVWTRYRDDARRDDRVSKYLENRLRVALQDHGQAVLLRYLQGDAITQTSQDFDSGALYFNATLYLDPDAPALEGRALFCRARRLIFEGRSEEAIPLLERAARIDPAGAYIYNALGIAYLERSEYSLARSAFRDAVRLSPRWIYPRHNLALANVQIGDYPQAELSYLEARKLEPRAFFLAYNLGMLYQQINRLKDGERLLREAAALEPSRPDAPNGLGLLLAGAGKTKEAETQYRAALALDDRFVLARHNLALLLWSMEKRRTEALSIWRQLVIDQPKLTSARAALAEALLEQGDLAEARMHYVALLRDRPESLSTRLALADCYMRSAAWADAERTLGFADPHPAVEEKQADVRAASGRRELARAGYATLLAKTSDSSVRKRLQAKIKGLGGAS